MDRGGLAEHDVPVEDGLALFLHLPPPALLGVLHLVEHVGAQAGAGQYVMGVSKWLLVLEHRQNIIQIHLVK